MKSCTQCETVKPTAEFHRVTRNKDGLSHLCKSCACQRMREWQANHKERVAERGRRYRLLHTERVTERMRKWYAANRDRLLQYKHEYRANHTEDVQTYEKLRSSSPERKEQRRVQNSRRMARIHGLSHTLTAREWQDTLNYFGNRCAYCLVQPMQMTQDHLIPVARGGGTDVDNIVPSCLQCNIQKGVKPLWRCLGG